MLGVLGVVPSGDQRVQLRVDHRQQRVAVGIDEAVTVGAVDDLLRGLGVALVLHHVGLEAARSEQHLSVHGVQIVQPLSLVQRLSGRVHEQSVDCRGGQQPVPRQRAVQVEGVAVVQRHDRLAGGVVKRGLTLVGDGDYRPHRACGDVAVLGKFQRVELFAVRRADQVGARSLHQQRRAAVGQEAPVVVVGRPDRPLAGFIDEAGLVLLLHNGIAAGEVLRVIELGRNRPLALAVQEAVEARLVRGGNQPFDHAAPVEPGLDAGGRWRAALRHVLHLRRVLASVGVQNEPALAVRQHRVVLAGHQFLKRPGHHAEHAVDRVDHRIRGLVIVQAVILEVGQLFALPVDERIAGRDVIAVLGDRLVRRLRREQLVLRRGLAVRD